MSRKNIVSTSSTITTTTTPLPRLPAVKINLKYMDQITYLQGYHRSGWSFVLKYLYRLHHPDGIWCDTYVDRTFHWYRPAGILPYTRPWIGFVHHTFHSHYSDYHCGTLLSNTLFRESLLFCKGLFVFTRILKTQWEHALRQLDMDVPVFALVHPTEFVTNIFSTEKWDAAAQPKLVQIGAWLRDPYAIYRVSNASLGAVAKAALLGPHMANYYKPHDFFSFFSRPQWKRPIFPDALDPPEWPLDTSGVLVDTVTTNALVPASVVEKYECKKNWIHDDVNDDDTDGNADGICRDLVCRDSDYCLNKYVRGAVALLKSIDRTVTLIPTLTDVEYDDLLASSIVFLKLVDAAAVNTLLECVVRHTPVIVNKIPPVVELLGPDYPMYYDDHDVNFDQVPSLLDRTVIAATTQYLATMNKTALRIDTFLATFAALLSDITE